MLTTLKEGHQNFSGMKWTNLGRNEKQGFCRGKLGKVGKIR